MNKTRILPVLILFVQLALISSSAYAATISTCTFDKTVYYPGQTGEVAVTVFNDEESKISIPELTASINYFYNDETAYVQTFYASLDPPVEIQPNQSKVLYVPFNLPHNISPGYTTLFVRAKTELWNNYTQTWRSSDYPTSEATLYIESPYKQQFEDTSEQLQELKAINTTTTNIMYVLGLATVGLAVAAIFLLLQVRSGWRYRRP